MDSAVRVLLGLWLIAHGVALTGRPFLTIAWSAVGILILGTGVLRVCPLYTIIGALRPHVVSRRP